MADSVVEELARKRLGRTIKGKWRLDRLIGVGGMAAVYAATHRNGARVAIKMLHATISASQQIRARFVREGYLANKVDHPGVVRVLDDDIDDQDQSAFLVMDLVVGATLSDRAMERLLDDKEVLDVAEQVLAVLSAAHKQGIVHRDLKPDNLLVDMKGKVHVLDFGIARLLDDATGSAVATKTGTAFGTPGFMAPEQALGKTQLISARTDLYSLGATLFALVSGDFVHAAENPQELMVLVATQAARSLKEVAPHMHPDVVALIDKSTRNEPENRWPSADAMLVEVKRVIQKIGSTPVMPITPYEPAEAKSSKVQLEISSDEMRAVPSTPLAPSKSAPPPPPTANAPAQNGMSPFGAPSAVALSTVAPTPAMVRRPKLLPVILVGGAAAAIGLVALVLAARRPPHAPTSAVDPTPAATQHETNAAATASTEPTATAAVTGESTQTTAPSPPDIDLSEEPTASSTAKTKPTAWKKNGFPPLKTTAIVPGTAKPPATATSTKKPIDVGY